MVEGVTWTQGMPPRELNGVVKIVERQQLEAVGEQAGAEMEGGPQGEPTRVAGNEMAPEVTEIEGDQVEVLGGEEEAGKSHLWEPEDGVTLEEEDENPKQVAEKERNQPTGIEGSEETHQQRALEGKVETGAPTAEEERQETRSGDEWLVRDQQGESELLAGPRDPGEEVVQDAETKRKEPEETVKSLQHEAMVYWVSLDRYVFKEQSDFKYILSTFVGWGRERS